MAKSQARKARARKTGPRNRHPRPKTWSIRIYTDNWLGFNRSDVADILNNHVGGAIKNGNIQLHIWEQPRWKAAPQATGKIDVIICPSFPCSG